MKSTNIIENPVYQKPLKQGHSLAISENDNQSLVQVKNAKGINLFSIHITEKGTTLQISAENIRIDAKKKMQFSAENIQFNSRKNITINNLGDTNINTEGNSSQIAKTHLIKASLGDVKLHANDDVKLSGERVKLNCDE